MGERNPLSDPRRGDRITNGRTVVRIDHVGDGQIFAAKFRAGAAEPFDFVRVSLAQYRSQCRQWRAEVVR